MEEDRRPVAYPAENDFQHLTPEEIETRAIEDATSGRVATFVADAADTEQAVEYRERRQFAIDEEDNRDPGLS